MGRHRTHNSNHRKRQASAYLIVLASAVMITVMGLSALMAQRIHLRVVDNETSLTKARIYARCAIEMGLARMSRNPDWQASYSAGTWITDTQVNGATYNLTGTAPDTNPITLTGTGTYGNAQHKLEVKINANTQPMDCLQTAMVAGSLVYFESCGATADMPICSNDTIDSLNCGVDADVEASSSITGGWYHQDKTTGTSNREMPTSDVFDFYTENGTSISINVVPEVLGTHHISNALFSPASNPFTGQTNSRGIYVIDCKDDDIFIYNCRVVGTLVLLNVGSNSAVGWAINWEPYITGYPALLVDGSATILMHSNDLSESSLGVNFNPAGTPYKSVEDNDTSDTYPTIIKGIVYATGRITTRNSSKFKGTLISSDSIYVYDSLTINHSSDPIASPPPGFRSTTAVQIVRDSWKQVVD